MQLFCRKSCLNIFWVRHKTKAKSTHFFGSFLCMHCNHSMYIIIILNIDFQIKLWDYGVKDGRNMIWLCHAEGFDSIVCFNYTLLNNIGHIFGNLHQPKCSNIFVSGWKNCTAIPLFISSTVVQLNEDDEPIFSIQHFMFCVNLIIIKSYCKKAVYRNQSLISMIFAFHLISSWWVEWN